MKESHNEGIASHIGPESWGFGREVVSQALTGHDATGLAERHFRRWRLAQIRIAALPLRVQAGPEAE